MKIIFDRNDVWETKITFGKYKGWEGLYKISNLGNVYDIKKDRLLKQYNKSVDDKHKSVYLSSGKVIEYILSIVW